LLDFESFNKLPHTLAISSSVISEWVRCRLGGGWIRGTLAHYVCTGYADTMLSLTRKFAFAFRPCRKQARSNWNFNTICRMVAMCYYFR